MLRYARYTAAVVFALLAVGFVALWVRSYTWFDQIGGPFANQIAVFVSNRGLTGWGVTEGPRPQRHRDWTIGSHRYSDRPATSRWTGKTQFGFGVIPRDNFGLMGLYLPHWFLAASSLALAALFAFERTWRYSLRTILVATTVVVAILGLAVGVV